MTLKRIILGALIMASLLVMPGKVARSQYCFGDPNCGQQVGCYGDVIDTGCEFVGPYCCPDGTIFLCCERIDYNCGTPGNPITCHAELSCPYGLYCYLDHCDGCPPI